MGAEAGLTLPRFHAVLLAGGQSTRMGRDKAALRLDGQSLQTRALELLQSLGPARLLLSGRDGLPDLFPGSGPPGGLYSSLHYLQQADELDGTPLLLIPVDMPLLNRALLLHLLTRLGEAAAAHYAGEVFPCVFRASLPLFRHLRELFEQSPAPGGARSMKALLAYTEAVALPREGFPAELFLNVNRPEEWETLCARLQP